jgi:hypothetical protein
VRTCRRIVQFRERLAGENRDKPDDHSVLLRNEHSSVRFAATCVHVLTGRVRQRFGVSQARIDGALEFLERDDALPHSCRVV